MYDRYKLALRLVVEKISETTFYGQELQDMYAYLWFHGKKDGFFLDIGAYDGIGYSNTYSLEKIGWTGICVEPVPELYEKLRKNRNCECINAAVSTDTKNDIFIVTKTGGRSGYIRNMSQHMLELAQTEGILREIEVKNITFEELIKNKKHIDFMSLDVEGSELEVLNMIDFGKYDFGLITIENNQRRNNGIRLEPYMPERGYKVLLDLGVDIMFIPKANN
jgi:FkbM family methyltransferase